MATNHFALARTYPATVVEPDRKTRKALVHSANRITHIGDVARVAMDEMTTNYVTAERLAAHALTAAHCQYQSVPRTELAQSYLATLSQHYLQRMIAVTNVANDMISYRVRFDEDEPDHYR